MKRYKTSGVLRLVSIIVLCFFTWSFGGVVDIAYAIQKTDNRSQKTEQKQQDKTHRSEEKFQKAIEDIEQILVDPATDNNAKKSKLRNRKAEIESIDTDIKKQFADTEKKLKDSGMPSEILERHYSFVKHYGDNLKELRNNLEAIDKAKDKAETEAAIEKTRKHLEKVKPPKKHTPLDPNKLPHRVPEIKDFPVIDKEKADFESKNPILVASAGSLNGLLAQNTTITSITGQTPPTAADLAETIEVKFTPEITAKAVELSNNPVKIYEYVRNNFQYEPYYGSLKGAQQTLQEMAGNDYDQASLLIALLRVSGIHARYVSGTIELPIERLMNWVGGAKTPNVAAQILATNGVPGALITEGGAIRYARFEHVWVEAYVDMFPSMGAVHKKGDSWTPLDPSFKEMKIADSVDIAKTLPFDETAYINNADDMPPVLSYIYKLKDYYDTNYGYEFYKIFHVAVSGIQEFGIFPGTLPYKTISEQRYSEVSHSKRHRLQLSLSSSDIYNDGTVYSVEKILPEIAGRKITLTYIPATSNDQTVINKYGGLLNTPAYLINVKPEIKLNDVTILSGPAIAPGSELSLTTELSGPNTSTDKKTTNITHGLNYAIGIPLLNYSGMQQIGQIDTLRALQGALYDSINLMDNRTGELLYNIALEYFTQLNGLSKSIEGIMHIHNTKLPSIALVSADASYNEIFGIAMSPPIMKGLSIDAIRLAHSSVSLDGDMAQRKEFNKQRGLNSSYLEHKILENLLEVESISAVKALQTAAKNGVPIFTINQSNIGSILSMLNISTSDKTDIQNAVNAGKEVTVSRDPITLQDWTGTGYIARDPNSGSGAYMISNSMGGSGTVKPTNPAFDKEQKIAWFISGNPIGYNADVYWWERLVIDRVVEIFALPAWQKYGYMPCTVLYATKETLLLATNHANTWILHYSGHAGDGVLQPAKGDNGKVSSSDIKVDIGNGQTRPQDLKIVFLNGCSTTKSEAFAQVFGVTDHSHNGEERKEVLLGWPDERNMHGDEYALQFWMRMGMGKTVQEAVDYIKARYISLPWASDTIKFYPTIRKDGGATTLIP